VLKKQRGYNKGQHLFLNFGGNFLKLGLTDRCVIMSKATSTRKRKASTTAKTAAKRQKVDETVVEVVDPDIEFTLRLERCNS